MFKIAMQALIISIFLFYINPSSCEMTGFIVGGQFAQITEFPHATFLKIDAVLSDGHTTHWICGGSIVNQKIILTAAHCLENAIKVHVTVGSANKATGKSLKAKHSVIHEKYKTKTCECDIGLIGLSRTLILNANVRRVVLMRNPPYKELGYVAGWGVIDDYDKVASTRLKYLDQKVQDWKKCKPKHQSILNGTFCARSKNPAHYASIGDSGSALIVRGYIQIGLVSYRTSGTPPNAVIYTDVGYYHDWIRRVTNQLVCNR